MLTKVKYVQILLSFGTAYVTCRRTASSSNFARDVYASFMLELALRVPYPLHLMSHRRVQSDQGPLLPATPDQSLCGTLFLLNVAQFSKPRFCSRIRNVWVCDFT